MLDLAWYDGRIRATVSTWSGGESLVGRAVLEDLRRLSAAHRAGRPGTLVEIERLYEAALTASSRRR